MIEGPGYSDFPVLYNWFLFSWRILFISSLFIEAIFLLFSLLRFLMFVFRYKKKRNIRSFIPFDLFSSLKYRNIFFAYLDDYISGMVIVEKAHVIKKDL